MPNLTVWAEPEGYLSPKLRQMRAISEHCKMKIPPQVILSRDPGQIFQPYLSASYAAESHVQDDKLVSFLINLVLTIANEFGF